MSTPARGTRSSVSAGGSPHYSLRHADAATTIQFLSERDIACCGYVSLLFNYRINLLAMKPIDQSLPRTGFCVEFERGETIAEKRPSLNAVFWSLRSLGQY
jgi:hypothetical protein